MNRCSVVSIFIALFKLRFFTYRTGLPVLAPSRLLRTLLELSFFFPSRFLSQGSLSADYQISLITVHIPMTPVDSARLAATIRDRTEVLPGDVAGAGAEMTMVGKF